MDVEKARRMAVLYTSKGYARFHASEPQFWSHFHADREFVKMYGSDLVFSIAVIEDEQGDHYAWWDNEECFFRYLWPSRAQVDMCFPYGYKEEEDRGRGRVCRVRVEKKEE